MAELNLKSKIPVLVDFYSDWCPPCKLLELIFKQLEEEFKGKIKFIRVNVEENREIAAQYRVMSIPTLILFKNGQEVKRIVGLRSKEELRKELDG